jgi:hypothetical protein
VVLQPEQDEQNAAPLAVRAWTRDACGPSACGQGASEQEALLLPKLALACFQAAYERWVRDPTQDLPALVDDSFATLTSLRPPG